MSRPFPAGTPLSPADFEALREILDRLVRKVCPAWLASERDDLVQSACLRIVRKCQGGEEEVTLASSYLWMVAHSTVMDEIRHRRRSREVAWEGAGGKEPATEASSAETRQAREELRDAIRLGIRTLEESRRQAVLLYLHGFSLEESARILGWNTKRVDNQRYHGLRQLRDYLTQRGLGTGR